MVLAGVAMAALDTAVVVGRTDTSVGLPYFGMTVGLGAWLGLGAAGLWAVVARVGGWLGRRTAAGPILRGGAWGLAAWVPTLIIARPWTVYDPYHLAWGMLAASLVAGATGGAIHHHRPRWWPPLCIVGCVTITLADALVWYGHFARVHDLLAYVAFALGTIAAWTARDRWLHRRPIYLLAVVVLASHLPLLRMLRPVTTTAAFYGAVAPKALGLLHALTDFDGDGFSGVFGGGDCDDRNAARSPGICEVANNGIDDNCNERTDGVPSVRAAVAPSPWGATPRPDLYLIIIDTMRADWGGQGAPESLDPLRSESLVFSRAYSPYPLTERAMTAMVQGRYWRYVAASRPTLLGALVDVGYDVQIWHGTHRVHQATRTLFRRDEATASLMRLEFRGKVTHSQAIIDDAIADLGTANARPMMRWLHLDDPHYPRTKGEQSHSDRQRYVIESQYAAAQVARFIEALNRTERGRNAVVVLLGDHGEEFGEHGGQRHGATLYEETLRVPLWIRLPDTEPRTIDSVVSLIDVFPTLAHVLGLAQPRGLQGVNLLKDEIPSVRVLAQIDRVTARWSSSDRPTLRAVTDGRYKLIADIDRNVALMFDLQQDPGETRTIAHREPARARELLEVLAHWQDQPGCVPADR